jgi:hypothetical protein
MVVFAASYHPPSEFALPIYVWRRVIVIEHVQAYLDGLDKHAFTQSPPLANMTEARSPIRPCTREKSCIGVLLPLRAE